MTASLAIFMSRSSLAADPSVPNDRVGLFGEGRNAFASPEPSTGSMTYTYDFELPRARGLAQPSLALNYNSSSGEREAGYGWGLDLPVIERRPLSGFASPGDNDTPRERYTFSGQPLVKVCDAAEACAGQVPAWAHGWAYYRLQVEGLFARFFRKSDRRTWRVQLKGGELLELGAPLDGLTIGDGLETDAEHTDLVLRYRLVRRIDSAHPTMNFVAYRWVGDTPLANRLLYLKDIYDTPSIANPTSIDGFAHHTQLDWSPPDFRLSFYANVDRAAPRMRLDRIAVATVDPEAEADQPRQVVRQYFFSY